MAAQDSSTIPTLATLDLDDDEGEGEPQAQDETASEDGSDDELELPTFKLPAEPPQLDSLSLPSPIFGRSFVDLLAPLPSTPTTPSSIGSTSHLPHRPPSRLRSGSALSRTSIYDRVREPTLQFSNPREEADRRVRRPGKDEDVFIGTFPDHEMELGVDSPPEWVDEEWKELGEFLLKRGYRVEGEPASVSGAFADRARGTSELTSLVVLRAKSLRCARPIRSHSSSTSFRSTTCRTSSTSWSTSRRLAAGPLRRLTESSRPFPRLASSPSTKTGVPF